MNYYVPFYPINCLLFLGFANIKEDCWRSWIGWSVLLTSFYYKYYTIPMTLIPLSAFHRSSVIKFQCETHDFFFILYLSLPLALYEILILYKVLMDFIISSSSSLMIAHVWFRHTWKLLMKFILFSEKN